MPQKIQPMALRAGGRRRWRQPPRRSIPWPGRRRPRPGCRMDALGRSTGLSEPTRSSPRAALSIASPTTRPARRQLGRSSHRPLGPAHPYVASLHHSSLLPSPERYGNRYETEWRANFHEKAHSVKADVAAPWWSSPTILVLRAMLPSALSVSPLLGGSVHYGIRLFGLPRRRCDLRIGLSSS